MSKAIIYDDLYRYVGDKSLKSYIKYKISNHGFRYMCILRKINLTKNPIKMKFLGFKLKKLSYKYGLEINKKTKIGAGFYIGHAYNITINQNAEIGCNVNIHKGVTIGQENRGKRKGAPIIGDNVWIGVNSTIVGKIKVGNNVLIAPNSYVNFNVPNNSIVIGNPAKVINCRNATKEYLNRCI